MAPRLFRFHAVRTDTCRALLCRVHRYLQNSAIIVCRMGFEQKVHRIPGGTDRTLCFPTWGCFLALRVKGRVFSLGTEGVTWASESTAFSRRR